MKTFISLIIVFLIAVFSFWLQDIFKEAPIIKTKEDAHFPDYFMENFTITSMNENGQPAYILNAKRMEHFSDDDSAEFENPYIEFKDSNGNWSISAKRAHIVGDKNIIHLYNEVKVRRSISDTRGPLDIDTDYLKINTESEIAETHKLAHLKTKDVELDTLGMVFDNKQGILKLMSQVKGSYAPAK